MRITKFLVAVAATALLSPKPVLATINSVVVSGTTVTINGASFGVAKVPVVTLGGAKVTVATGAYTATKITGTVPSALVAGSYRLTVQTWTSATKSTTEPTYEVTVGAVGPVGPQGPVGPAPDVQIFTGVEGPCTNGGVKVYSDFLVGYAYACNGVDGANGQQGPQGLKGDQGNPGPKGDTGPQGAPGTCTMPTCPAGQALLSTGSGWMCQSVCSGLIVDTQTDLKNCGACGATCAGTCDAGVCNLPPCTWTQVGNHDLTTTPAGSVLKSSGWPGQGPSTVSGRTAWLQGALDWNLLLVPTGLTSTDDVVAFEVDLYTPLLGSGSRGAALALFQKDEVAGYCQAIGGIMANLIVGSDATTLIDWQQHTPTGCSPSVVRNTAITHVGGRWSRVRIEGSRSACRFRASVDGVVQDDVSIPGCEFPGPFLTLLGHDPSGTDYVNVAWSNLSILKGTAACAP